MLSSKSQLEALVDKIDALLRDTAWSPFVRREGRIEGVDPGDGQIVKYKRKYGQGLVDLIVAKRREIEKHNPSGHYPVKLLATPDGRLLSVQKVLEEVIAKLLPEAQQEEQQGGGVGGGGGNRRRAQGRR